MKKVSISLIVIIIVISVVGCKQSDVNNAITTLNKTPHEKAVDYIRANGVKSGTSIYLSYQDYFIEQYHTYFIVYNSETDSFSFEQYSSDEYYDIPPTSYEFVDVCVMVDLDNGEAKYYTNGECKGIATIDITSYTKEDYSFSDVEVFGKYESVNATTKKTFEVYVCTLVRRIGLYLSQNNANITVQDLGFISFTESESKPQD